MAGAEILAQLNLAISQLTLSQLTGLVILAIWESIWTGIAMWKAARKNHIALFILFFIINFFGIPEIIYIFGFKGKKQAKPKIRKKSKKK